MFERTRARNPNHSVLKSAIYVFCRTIARWVIRLLFRGRVFHSDRVPADGHVLIVANHQSFIDPPFVGCFITQRQIAYIARAGLFKFRPFGWLLSAINAIPIREDGAGDTAAIKTALSVLASGFPLVIFPEGSRTRDGALHEFKRGAALLVKRAKCPVVPVAVEGCFDAWSINHKRPRPFGCPILAMYGHAIPYEELMKDGADAAMDRLARTIEDMRMELRAKIRQKSGGRYPAPGPGDHHYFAPPAGPTAASPAPAAPDTLRA
jgi:1-acyl-sn-glycerol-3-phosphate acyltransferase